MAYRFTPADRGAFKRCRRQWDFGARERQNLEPAEAAAPDLRLDPEPAAGTAWSRLRRRLIHSDRQIRRSGHQRGLPQHQGSGGGRSLPYARRGAARSRPSDPGPVASEGDGTFRRTRILRDRAELEAIGARLATEALDMVDPDLRLYPSPAPEHCGACRFVALCLAIERGQDVRAVLQAGYRDRGPERVEPGRLGAATWGTGRGAAPPRFDRG